MRKIDQPANCVGVVTVKWTVQNGDTKTVCSQEVGFASGWMNIEKPKRRSTNTSQEVCRKEQAFFRHHRKLYHKIFFER